MEELTTASHKLAEAMYAAQKDETEPKKPEGDGGENPGPKTTTPWTPTMKR